MDPREGLVARVYVTPKRGILDPQGKAVQHSLHVLGFGEVHDVTVGKYIELRLRDADRTAAAGRVREMCERLLANGVIEDFRFDLAEPPGVGGTGEPPGVGGAGKDGR